MVNIIRPESRPLLRMQKPEKILKSGVTHRFPRDIIYVKDVARAFVLALRSDKTYGLYNMTSGTELTLEEQVQTVIDVFGPGKGSKIVYRPDKPNNTPSFLFDMTKAKEDFGFVPEYLSYRAIMEDYKKELESGRWDKFIASRRKDK